MDALPARVYLGFERAERAFAAVKSVARSAAVCGFDGSSCLVEVNGFGAFGEGGAAGWPAPLLFLGNWDFDF